MNSLQVFNSPEFGQLRTVEIDGEVWFVLRDICNVLDVRNISDTASRLEKDEVGKTDIVDSAGRNQEVNIINESGLYSVILRSNKAEAKNFKRWVTHEVIPSIRKTGGYSLPQRMSPNEIIAQIAQANVEFEKRLDSIEQRVQESQDKLKTTLRFSPLQV